MGTNHTFHKIQTQTETFNVVDVSVLHAVEFFKHFVTHILRNADAFVNYIDLDAIQSRGEPAKKFTFQILDRLTPPSDPNQTEETHG